MTILGHIQRGGSPSVFDRLLASRLGANAVQSLIDGKSNIMVGLKGSKLSSLGLDEVLQTKKELDIGLYDLANTLS